MSLRRRYNALRARADDQAGKPEGELCAHLADRLRARYPNLADEDLPTRLAEYRWSHGLERDLLARIGEYLGVTPQHYRHRPRYQCLVFVTDDPTHAIIRHAYETLRPKMNRLIEYTAVAFMVGALPIARRRDDRKTPELDPDLSATVSAGFAAGARSRPSKALPE